MDIVENSLTQSFVFGILKYPIAFLVAFCATYVLTPIVREWAIGMGIVDKPSAGRINTRIVPRAGGLAVFFGFHLSLLVALFFVSHLEITTKVDTPWWLSFSLGSIVILCIGLIDDIMDMRPIIKLGGQIAVAVLMYSTGLKFSGVLGLDIPGYLELICTVVWFLAIINAFNLIDGLDGLATGLAIIGAAGIAGALFFLGHPGDALVLFGFIGACLAFLRFNFHPATIFLGDSGSMFLGFTLAAVGLAVGTKGATVAALGVPLLAVGVPMFDTILAIWRRSVRRLLSELSNHRIRDHANGQDEALISLTEYRLATPNGVMHRDMDHLHHRLLRGGRNQKRVAVLLYTTSSLLVLTGLSSMVFASASAGIFLICFVVGTYVVVRYVARIELWDSGSAIVQGLQMPSARGFFRLMAPVSDCLFLGVMLFVSLYLTKHDLNDITSLKHTWRDWVPVLAGVPLSIIALSGGYSTIWTRARISEFFSFAVQILAGGLVAWGLLILAGLSTLSQEDTVSVVLYLLLALCFMLGSRAVPSLVGDLMSLTQQMGRKENEAVRNILLFGAGKTAILFIRQHGYSAVTEDSEERVVGLLDRDESLLNRYVHGYRVLGGVDKLAAAVTSLKVDEVVVTEIATPEEEAHLLRASIQLGFELSRWVTRKEPYQDAQIAAMASHNILLSQSRLASNG